MKLITKTILAAGILTAGLANAQSSDMKNMLKVGVNAGVALPSTNASANVGLDVAYQHLVTPGFGLGIATGYSQFFGKDVTINNVKVENNNFGVVPVAAMVRVYPQKTGFYLGTDLGYGFITGDDRVTSNAIYNAALPKGGFYIKPEIGYHNKDWNFALQYQKVFTGDEGKVATQDFNAGALGLGVSYNIPLGQ